MKERKKVLLWLLIVAVLLAASIITGNHAGQSETIQQTMRDAVLHNENRIDLLGWKAVNPGLISGFVVTAILLIAAAVLRVFWIPRFKYVPGRCQLVLEEVALDTMEEIRKPYQVIVSVSSNYTATVNRFEPGADEEIQKVLDINLHEFLHDEVYVSALRGCEL